MTPSPEVPRASEAEPAGELAGGRYVIVGTLGAGSQGETLDAVDKREGRPVAIKRFTIRNAKSWKDVELAEREAQVLASVQHPGLPRYIEHFEADGALYLVMEKVEGETLAARRRRGAVLNREQVLRFLADAAACLRYLHGHAPPIVHRDIKPGNVILRPDGSYCLVDFGSVRDRLKPEGGSTVVGTFGYMAPEQFQGRASPASDVYAVGATALTLISGRDPEDLPHKGLAIDVDGALRGQVDRRLLAALRTMLEPDPDRRPSSVDEALKTAGLVSQPPHTSRSSPNSSRTAQAAKQARRARLEAEDEWHDRRARKVASKVASAVSKAAVRDARRQERHARRAARHYHRRGPAGPPFIPLGIVVLLALQIASLATFALFQVLLPTLFTFIPVPGRRKRMLEIGRSGERGLSRTREYIRYKFMGGPIPPELQAFLNEDESANQGESRPPRQRVVDVVGDEVESRAEAFRDEIEARAEAFSDEIEARAEAFEGKVERLASELKRRSR